MPFITDSRYAGYLGPHTTPAPLEGEAWTNFLQEMVVGVTGMNPTLVRPRWQKQPLTPPPIDVDWAAIGVMDTDFDWSAAVVHVPDGDGFNALQRMETVTLLCSFYGPNDNFYAGILRDGLAIEQNRWQLRVNAVAVVEVTGFTRAAELFREQFRDRLDTNIILRREVRRNYSVLNLLRAHGTIAGNDPSDRVVTTTFDTDQ